MVEQSPGFDREGSGGCSVLIHCRGGRFAFASRVSRNMAASFRPTASTGRLRTSVALSPRIGSAGD